MKTLAIRRVFSAVLSIASLESTTPLRRAPRRCSVPARRLARRRDSWLTADRDLAVSMRRPSDDDRARRPPPARVPWSTRRLLRLRAIAASARSSLETSDAVLLGARAESSSSLAAWIYLGG
mmetsp:Transcript_5294/g.21845  ORF Transcript_5294/g.21845 Transcript_5294/m.21845 type:complete len:122 (+) Transcript_5294:801-1166(+)